MGRWFSLPPKPRARARGYTLQPLRGSIDLELEFVRARTFAIELHSAGSGHQHTIIPLPVESPFSWSICGIYDAAHYDNVASGFGSLTEENHYA